MGSDIFGPNRDVGCQVTVAGWRVATDGSLGRAAALTMLGSVFDLIFEMIHLKSPGVSGRFLDLRKHLGGCLLDGFLLEEQREGSLLCCGMPVRFPALVPKTQSLQLRS